MTKAAPHSATKHDMIEPAACRHLLTAVTFGRMAVVDGGEPALIVMNHMIDGEDLIFRTGDDSRLATLTSMQPGLPAVFEVDSAFPPEQAGWSVMATGHLQQETDPAVVEKVHAELTAWAGGEHDTVLRLKVDQLTGRRVGPLT